MVGRNYTLRTDWMRLILFALVLSCKISSLARSFTYITTSRRRRDLGPPLAIFASHPSRRTDDEVDEHEACEWLSRQVAGLASCHLAPQSKTKTKTQPNRNKAGRCRNLCLLRIWLAGRMICLLLLRTDDDGKENCDQLRPVNGHLFGTSEACSLTLDIVCGRRLNLRGDAPSLTLGLP